MDTEFNVTALIGGLVVGLIFGAVMQRSRFCIMAAIGNWVMIRDARHLHGLLVAILVAVVGTQFLEYVGLVAISETSYRASTLDWFGGIAGGLMFGFGTVLAGGCAARICVRTAEGDSSALLVLLAFAITAALALYGPLSEPRAWLFEHTAFDLSVIQFPALVAKLNTGYGTSLVMLMVGTTMVYQVGQKTESLYMMVAGAIVGLLIVAGWYITGYMANDPFNPVTPSSMTFSGPLARTAFFAVTGQVPAKIFGIGLVGGIIAGALIFSVSSGSFHFKMVEGNRIGQYLIGGSMMGIGATLAGGCNIGQLTGLSTGSPKALLAMIAIAAGIYLGMRWLENRE